MRREVLPYQWEALNDRIPEAAPSYCMRDFKVAGRMMREKKEKGAIAYYQATGKDKLLKPPVMPCG